MIMATTPDENEYKPLAVCTNSRNIHNININRYIYTL